MTDVNLMRIYGKKESSFDPSNATLSYSVFQQAFGEPNILSKEDFDFFYQAKPVSLYALKENLPILPFTGLPRERLPKEPEEPSGPALVILLRSWSPLYIQCPFIRWPWAEFEKEKARAFWAAEHSKYKSYLGSEYKSYFGK